MSKKVKLSLIIGLGIAILFFIVLPVILSSVKSDSGSKSEGLFSMKKQSPSELENKLKKQPVKVVNSYYKVQDERLKRLYPDQLVVDLKNESKKDIKNITVGFVGWDKNGLPIKIKGNIDFRPAYFKPVINEEVNMSANSDETHPAGIELDERVAVEAYKPIIVEYVDYDGKTWKNPELENFKKIYEEKKLHDIKEYKELVYFKNQTDH